MNADKHITLGVKKILRAQRKENDRSIKRLFDAVMDCVDRFGYVQIEAGNPDAIPYPRVGVKWTGKPVRG